MGVAGLVDTGDETKQVPSNSGWDRGVLLKWLRVYYFKLIDLESYQDKTEGRSW